MLEPIELVEVSKLCGLAVLEGPCIFLGLIHDSSEPAEMHINTGHDILRGATPPYTLNMADACSCLLLSSSRWKPG